MQLSALQKYILKQCALAKDRTIPKSVFENFYSNKVNRPSRKDAINIITKSVERLIKKELVIVAGWKTPHKWFIKQVKPTPKGRKLAKSLFGVQQKLPLRSQKSNLKS